MKTPFNDAATNGVVSDPYSLRRSKNVISSSMKTALIKYARVSRWIEREIGSIVFE